MAYGGVAATPQRALTVEEFLRGKTLDAATVREAGERLRAAFTPLSDHRASADSRRALCANLFTQFVPEHCACTAPASTPALKARSVMSPTTPSTPLRS